MITYTYHLTRYNVYNAPVKTNDRAQSPLLYFFCIFSLSFINKIPSFLLFSLGFGLDVCQLRCSTAIWTVQQQQLLITCM